MGDIKKILKYIPQLRDISQKKINEISKKMEIKNYSPGEIIIKRGEKSNFVCYIISGEVKIYMIGKNNIIKTLNVLNKGNFFGEMALIMNTPRSANVQALTNVSILIIPKKIFLELIKLSYKFALFIIYYLCSRLDNADKQLESLSFQNAKSRIIATLLRLLNDYGKYREYGVEIDIELSLDDVSELAGVDVEITKEFFAELITQKILYIKNKKIVISRQEELRNLIITE